MYSTLDMVLSAIIQKYIYLEVDKKAFASDVNAFFSYFDVSYFLS